MRTDVFEKKTIKVQESNVCIGNESRKEYLDRFIAGIINFETSYYH